MSKAKDEVGEMSQILFLCTFDSTKLQFHHSDIIRRQATAAADSNGV